MDRKPSSSIFTEPLIQPKEGMLTLPTGPGLGLEPDRRTLQRFAVKS